MRNGRVFSFVAFVGMTLALCTGLVAWSGDSDSSGSASSTLELTYARQFEGGVPPAKTATFDVTVQ